MQGGLSALLGYFNLHSVSFRGGPYPLPCGTTFRVRDALHLFEACDSVTYVRGVFQRLLPLLGKANLVADIRSRAGLVSFAIIFSFDCTFRAVRDALPRWITVAFSLASALSAWPLVLGSISAMRPRIRFLFDANDHRSVGFLRFAFMHICADLTRQEWLPANLEQGSQI